MKRNFELLTSRLKKNYLKESTNSPDVGKWEPLIIPLVEKIYPETLVSQIADVQPISSPTGKVAALYSMYTGDKNDVFNVTYLENSKILGVPYTHFDDITVNSQYLISGPTTATPAISGTVLYKENVPYATFTGSGGSASPFVNYSSTATIMVVRIDTDNASEVTTDLIFNTNAGTADIIYMSANRTSIKKLLSKYSMDGDAFYNDSNTNVKVISKETRTVAVESKIRKIKSQFSTENIQDLQSIYGENYLDIVAKIVGNEVRQEIDKEIINYLKDIATPMPQDIRLIQSLGMQSGVYDVSNDLIVNILLAAEQIVRATKRNRTFFVLADSSTCAYLQINPWHVIADPEQDNPYYVGKIGAYPLYCDMYSDEHYILVGYRFDSDESGDSGLIFAPYVNTIIEADGVEPMFQKHLLSVNRYGYIRHPQDSGTGIGDSDFFRIMHVDYTGMNGVVQPTGMEGIFNMTGNLIRNI